MYFFLSDIFVKIACHIVYVPTWYQLRINYKYQVIHTYLYFQPVIFMVFVSVDLFSLWRDIMKTWRIHLMCKVHLSDNIMTCKNNVNVCRRWSSWEYHMYIVKVHMKYKLQKIRPLDLKLVTFHNPMWVFGWELKTGGRY